MSPLDDELRAALHGRATALPPSPDPLAGIERRAQRIRRTRVGAAVAGSVLAVAMVAVAVPAVQTATSSQRDLPRVAQSQPPQAPSYALDPQRPWAYRGEDLSGLGQGGLETIEREYAAKRGAARATITPLYGATYEPSQQFELVFLAEVDGVLSWGVAVSPTEAGPEFLWDDGLPEPALALAAPLAGDEGVGRLLVVAAPDAGAVQYGPNDASEFDDTTALAPGVAVTPLDGDPDTDLYRVLDRDGAEVVRADAPDLAAARAAQAPANRLDWGPRGEPLDPALEEQLLARYVQAVTAADQEPPHSGATYSPLFTGSTDTGVRFTVGQAWVQGRPAHSVSLSVGGTEGEQFFLGPETDPAAPVLAFLLCCEPGSSVDTLVVVPRPGTGQVLYDDDGTGPFRPVGEGQDGLDGVVLVDRSRTPDDDRLQLLDGDGDLDSPTFQGPVLPLLCGLRECG